MKERDTGRFQALRTPLEQLAELSYDPGTGSQHQHEKNEQQQRRDTARHERVPEPPAVVAFVRFSGDAFERFDRRLRGMLERFTLERVDVARGQRETERAIHQDGGRHGRGSHADFQRARAAENLLQPRLRNVARARAQPHRAAWHAAPRSSDETPPRAPRFALASLRARPACRRPRCEPTSAAWRTARAWRI